MHAFAGSYSSINEGDAVRLPALTERAAIVRRLLALRACAAAAEFVISGCIRYSG